MRLEQTGQGRLVAVVVTHDRLPQLQITLQRLLETPAAHLAAVVVVDNASRDGTAEWLAGVSDPRLVAEVLPTNQGGAGGFAHGMRTAMTQCDPDWLVLMDDDGRPATGETLSRFHSLPLEGWDALAAAVYTKEGEICDMNRPSQNPFWHKAVFLRTVLSFGRRSGFHLGPKDYASTEPRAVDVTSFVGFFVRATRVAALGYPDPGLFVYGDDGLYSLALRKAGGRIAFHPALRFEHDISTFAGKDRRFRPLWKAYYYHRNLLLMYREASGWMFWLVLCVVVPRWILRGFAQERGRQSAYNRLLRHALSDGLHRRLDANHAEILALSEQGDPKG